MYRRNNQPIWDDCPAQKYQDHYYQQDNYPTHYQHNGYYDQYQDDYQGNPNYLSNPSRQPRAQQSQPYYQQRCQDYYDPPPTHEQEEASMSSLMKSMQETINYMKEETARNQSELEIWQAEYEQENMDFQVAFQRREDAMLEEQLSYSEETCWSEEQEITEEVDATEKDVISPYLYISYSSSEDEDYESGFESEDEEDVDIIQTVQTPVDTEPPVVQLAVEPHQTLPTHPDFVSISPNPICSSSDSVSQEIDEADVKIIEEDMEIIPTVPNLIISSTLLVITDTEEVHNAESQCDLGDISLEDFLTAFMEPNDVMESDEAHEPDSFILPFMNFDSKEDDIFDSRPHMKKPEGTDLHVPHPINHHNTPYHLWLGNLLLEGTYHYYHPHLNLNVEMDTLISSK